MTDPTKELQRIFEFVVKHKADTMDWPSPVIRRFLKWAAYYRRLFIVHADTKDGGRRIIAVGTAWRTESLSPNLDKLDFEHTEFGNYLFIHQCIVHPEFRNAGVLFQMLCLGLQRYPECHTAYWNDSSCKTRVVPINRFMKLLSAQISPPKLRPFIRRESWEAIKSPAFQILKPLA